jgi:hypothetical protein
MAFARDDFVSAIARTPRRAATSSATSSGDTIHVSQPGTSSVASRTSSSIARVNAPRSSADSFGARRVFARESDFTGTATTRIRKG